MSTAFEGYIGQHSLIRTLTKYLSLETFPNVLFSATKGSGKSELARRIAKAIDKPSYEYGCSSSMKLGQILYRLSAKWNGGVLFLDELPLLSKSAQASLRTLLEEGFYTDSEGERYIFPNLTVLAAGSDITKVDDDLQSRFRIHEFERYSIDDLVSIGQIFDTRFETNLDYGIIEKMALACRESPRNLRHLFEHDAKAIQASGDKVSIDAILETARIDAEGMTPIECTILLEMAEFVANGVNPTLSRLATKVGMRERTLIPTLENLEAMGFVSVSMGPGGRKITPLGFEKIRELRLRN